MGLPSLPANVATWNAARRSRFHLVGMSRYAAGQPSSSSQPATRCLASEEVLDENENFLVVELVGAGVAIAERYDTRA